MAKCHRVSFPRRRHLLRGMGFRIPGGLATELLEPGRYSRLEDQKNWPQFPGLARTESSPRTKYRRARIIRRTAYAAAVGQMELKLPSSDEVFTKNVGPRRRARFSLYLRKDSRSNQWSEPPNHNR